MARWPACKWILVATIVVFLLQIFWMRQYSPDDINSMIDASAAESEIVLSAEDRDQAYGFLSDRKVSVITEWFELDTEKVLKGQVWRVITTAFCHDRNGLMHILFNMLFLVWFGRRMEERYGTKEFAMFYFGAALLASLLYIGLDLILGARIPAIGASGAVMGVMVLFAFHFPREKILLFFILPVEIRWLVAFYLILDIHPIFLQLAGDPVASGVAHASHVGGALFGWLYFRNNWRLSNKFGGGVSLPSLKKPRSKRGTKASSGPKVVEMDGMEKRLDELLDKIKKSGKESLSTTELEFLERASKHYRDRDSS